MDKKKPVIIYGAVAVCVMLAVLIVALFNKGKENKEKKVEEEAHGHNNWKSKRRSYIKHLPH